MFFKSRPVTNKVDRAGVGYSGQTPYDLDAGERITRGATGVDTWPYPPIIGAISGFMPQQDMTIYRGMFKRLPTGPGVTTVPLNFAWQITVPGLTKMGN